MKKHKCKACQKTRLEKYMVIDRSWKTKGGKTRTAWMCGDCEEENRGRKSKLNQ